ncbi:uncharacterized protein [Dysidea avara]|uniref:uncharacterized protein n=1 Tax=Dysidea avara TaxID=196820 RepID=UPI00332E7F74
MVIVKLQLLGMLLLVLMVDMSMGMLYEHHVIVSKTYPLSGCEWKWNDCNYYCNSLESMFDLLKDKMESVDVFIEPGNYTLSSSHSLKDLHNIRIRSCDQTNIANIFCKPNFDIDPDIDTGIEFKHGSDLIVEYINIRWCGMKHISTSQVKPGTFVYFHSALYFVNCTGITVIHAGLYDNNGTGIAIVDSTGNVEINNSKFVNNSLNSANPMLAGGGGIYIEFTNCAPGFTTCSGDNKYNKQSHYIIDQCVFERNLNVYEHSSEPDDPVSNRHITFGVGGGLSIWLFGDAQSNMFYISSNFTNNHANLGGGFSFEFRDNSSHNFVDVFKSYFCHNSAHNYQGGGGALVGYIIYQSGGRTTSNNVTFANCDFIQNHAPKGCGGGIAWFGSREPNVSHPTNSFKVMGSSFDGNEAQLGSALSVTKEYFESIPSGVLLTMVIEHCSFINNSIQQPVEPVRTHFFIPNSPSGIGAVATTGFNIQFRAYTSFISNNSTALIGDGAVIEFYHDSVVMFKENHGLRGGAVLLIEGSFMNLYSNVSITFCENTATLFGGAIFAEMSTPFQYLESHICFVRYHRKDHRPSEWNVTLNFINNNSTRYINNTIFSGTLRPCMKEYSNLTLFQSSMFSYTPPFSNSTIATLPSKFNSTNATKYISPGKVFHLPVKLIDELNHDVTVFVLIATCKNHGQGVYVSQPFHYASSGLMQITGEPNMMCYLELKTDSNYQITTTVRVTLSNCQPGYYYNNHSRQCECINNKLHGNSVITCNSTDFNWQAYINPAYWIGYNTSYSTETLVGPCPFGYCYRTYYYNRVLFSRVTDSTSTNKTTNASHNSVPLPSYPLPPYDVNKTVLDQTVCGAANRANKLCGSCITNYSVLMNSPTFLCHNCSKKQWQVVFFFLSYIIPVTLLFFLFMTCKIRITYGLIGAFLFFAQIVSSDISVALNYYMTTDSSAVLIFFNILFSIYSISNLEFFQNDVFSYCLFEKAKTIQILTFKLGAALYPLGLIVVYSLVRSYHRPRCGLCDRCMQLHRSVTFGLSAFFVLCFSKINVLAFAILTPVEMEHFNTTDGKWRGYQRVVYYQGDIPFFDHDRHLPYAISALVVVTLIVIIPTIILLFHPLVVCVLGKLGLGQSRLIRCIERTLQVHKMKLLLDSFQSDYKQKYRFFAGLHFFLYRTLIFVILMVTPTPNYSYMQLMLIAVLSVILVIHLLIRPFRSSNDNVAYTLVYFLLIVLIGILYINGTEQGHPYTIYLGTILSSIPLLCLLCYVCWKIKIFVQAKLAGENLENSGAYHIIDYASENST